MSSQKMLSDLKKENIQINNLMNKLMGISKDELKKLYLMDN